VKERYGTPAPPTARPPEGTFPRGRVARRYLSKRRPRRSLRSAVGRLAASARGCATRLCGRPHNKEKSFRTRKREEHGLERISHAEGLVLN
jgi:hypothetical protein